VLKLAKKTFEKFNIENIKYCHWKSNEHLEAGLNGKTDLDILVDKKDFVNINRILLVLGFKRTNTIDYLDYNSVEDFIGFDNETGEIIHIHLHYELILGKKFIKEYHLPFEKLVLDNRIFNKKNNIYIIDPNLEIILLIIRRAFKSSFFNKNKNIFPEDEKKEYLWLLDKIDINDIKKFASILVNEYFAQLILEFINREKYTTFSKIKKIVNKEFKIYSLYSNICSLFKYIINKSRAAKNYIKNKIFDMPVIYRRGFKDGGIIVAFLGVDGAGKSTLIQEINKWISWKVDTQHIYFGSGDGKSSLLRLPLRFVAKLRSKLKGNVVSNSRKKDRKKKKNIFFRIMKVIWALTLALEKKKKLKKMWKARTKGMVVLTDRYPQTQFFGYNDGPLLRGWNNSENRLKKVISDWEFNIYDLANKLKPDLVIKLKIPEEVAVERKKDTPLYMIRNKIEVIENLNFAEDTKVKVVNTNRSVEESSLVIKNHIWSYLNNGE
jgi:thymidylate kinase